MEKQNFREVARRVAFLALYQMDINGSCFEDVSEINWYENVSGFDNEEGLLVRLDPKLVKKANVYYKELLVGTLSSLKTVDEAISKYLVDWDFERLHPIDRALLRLAVYSIIYHSELPSEVIISEANEFAYEYSDDDSFKYINGILNSIKAEYRRNYVLDWIRPKKKKKITRKLTLKKVKK